MAYRLSQGGCVIRIEDGAVIPSDAANRDYAKYLEWVETGNEAAPYVAEPEPITAEMVRAEGARRLALIGAPYSAEERETWPRQVEQANAVSANPEANVPLLTRLAEGRGITVAQMAATVIAKAAAFDAAAGDILAAQSALLAMDPIPADYAADARWTSAAL